MINMKIFRQNITIITTIFFIQFISSPAMATEKQQYRVIRSEKEFEIRFYPSATLATVYSEAGSYKELAYPGFRKLAGYIFGGNESETKISMTSPVYMDINDSRSSMSFVMPSSFNSDNLPKPDDPDVVVEKTDDVYMAVVRFGGYASDKDIKYHSEKLKKLLEEKAIEYYGNFKFLGYDPPFQPFGRKNEIIVAVNWSE